LHFFMLIKFVKKTLVSILIDVRTWIVPENKEDRSELQQKIYKLANKWIRQLTPKEKYAKDVADCVARMRVEYGLTDGDSFDTPSIVGTASQD
jgi:hypothetical protein